MINLLQIEEGGKFEKENHSKIINLVYALSYDW